jgi:SAM-dependent methyltransferase
MNLFAADNLSAAEALSEKHWQYRATRVLLTAHQLGIFTALRQSKTAAEAAAAVKTDADMTERLLIACCAQGLVRCDNGRYWLTQLARDTLLPESPRYMGGVLDHGESLWWSWSGLTETVRTGGQAEAPSPPEHYVSHWHSHFIWAMHGIAANGAGQFLARQIGLNGRKRLLDVGGGPGTYSIILCQRFPNLKAVVWDLPETLIITRENVEKFGLADRITTQAGDWDRDEFGTGYDTLMMSNVLHGAGSQAEMKLAKAGRALKPGGLLIIHDFLLNNDKSGPLLAALFNIMVGAYTVDELLDVVRKAGFSDVSLVASDPRRGSGIVTAIRP